MKKIANHEQRLTMQIRLYDRIIDESRVITLLGDEGEEWSCYWASEVCAKYKDALAQSITYVCYEDGVLCGYSRSIDDCGFYVYVCDLLVKPEYRGKNIGRQLLECISSDHPRQTVFVMSDVDEYYQKQGYRREGSIFEVQPAHKIHPHTL